MGAIVDLIRSGDLERFVIVIFVFGTATFLFVTGRPVDDRLFDVVLFILGFYFGTIMQKTLNGNKL